MAGHSTKAHPEYSKGRDDEVECPEHSRRACPEPAEGVEGIEGPFWVYILECGDGSLYVGHTSDVTERLARHREGRGSRHTAIRGVVGLVWSERHPTESGAVRRELQIKHWSRAKKLALIKGRMEDLKSLARARKSNA